MANTNAERQKRYRERKKAERNAKPKRNAKPAENDLTTVAGCTAELQWLARQSRELDITRDEISARAEYRKQLELLLKRAHDDELAKLLADNKSLNDQLDRMEASKQGHAVRADQAEAPPTYSN